MADGLTHFHFWALAGLQDTAVTARTATSSKKSAMMNVPIQLTTLATAIAFGLGPCRNSSAPIIIGIGPAHRADTLCAQ